MPADLAVEDLAALDGQPEVHDFRETGIADDDVRRLQVEMDDAVAVDVVERRDDLQDGVVEGLPILAVEELGDPPAREVLHGEVRIGVMEQAVVVDLDDVRMVEPGQRRELSLEPDELLRLGQLMTEDLDRLVALVGFVEDAIDRSGGVLFQDGKDLIARRKLQLGGERVSRHNFVTG